jgi:anti-sigma regulatory factor (Ser/Thr protein kinase)
MLLKINADLNQVASACQQILAAITIPVDNMAVELALTEGLNNAIIHGNHMRPETIVVLQLITQADAVTCVVTDVSANLSDAMLAMPQAPHDATSGRGLALIKTLASHTQIICGSLHITFLAQR